MSLFEELLAGKRIESVYADSEVIYLMLGDGTHVTIRGVVVVEPKQLSTALSGSDSVSTF